MKPRHLRYLFAAAALSASFLCSPLAHAATAKRRMVAIGDSIARGTQAAGKLGGGECPLDTPPGYYNNNTKANMHGGTCISRPAHAILDLLKKPGTYLPGLNLNGANVVLSTGLSNETDACKNGHAPVVRQQLAALQKDGVAHVAVLGTSANGHTYGGVPLNPMNKCLKQEVAKYAKGHPQFVAFTGPIRHTENTPYHIHPANYKETLKQSRKAIAALSRKP